MPALRISCPSRPARATSIVETLTVPDFVDLLSKKNVAAPGPLRDADRAWPPAARARRAGPSRHFLASGSEVFMKAVSYVMYYAPVGMAAYFAYLVGVFGPKLLGGVRAGDGAVLPRVHRVLLRRVHGLRLAGRRAARRCGASGGTSCRLR